MRALILIAAASLAAVACDRDDDVRIPDTNAVEVDACVAQGADSPACRRAEAKEACSESADQPVCVANYLDRHPLPQDRR